MAEAVLFVPNRPGNLPSAVERDVSATRYSNAAKERPSK